MYWKKVMSVEIVRADESGRHSLYARVTNRSDQDLTLPPITLWLSFTCFPGGMPGRGGNNLGAIGLKEDISSYETLAPGDTALLPVDTAKAPVQPAPLPSIRSPRSPDLPEWQEKMLADGEKRELAMSEDILSKPSLAAWLKEKGGDTFMVEMRAGDEKAGWIVTGSAAWGG